MPIGELSLPAWLGPGEPAGAPMLRGAQTGGIISTNLINRRQQKMREQQVELDDQEKRALIAGQYLHQKAVSQDMQLQAIKIADLMKQKDDQVEAEGALSVFGERIRRAKILGPNEPTAQAGVVDWAERYRGLLTTPAGKALWTDYMKSVDEDRENASKLEGIAERAAITAATTSNRNEQAFDIEDARQKNRVELEKMRLGGASPDRVGTEMTTPSGIHAVWVGPNQIRLTPKTGEMKDLTPAQMLSLSESPFMSSTNRTAIMNFLSGKAMGQVTNAPAVTTPRATSAPSSERIKVRGKDGKLYTLPHSQRQQAIDEGYTPVE